MGKYKLIGTVKSLAILPKEVYNFLITIENKVFTISINFENDNSISTTNIELTNKLKISADVYYEAQFKEDEIMEVISLFTTEVNKVMDKLSFVSAMPISDFRLTKCYDVTEGLEVRKFIQFDYNSIEKIGSRQIDLGNFDKFMESFSRLNKKINPRVERAIHWYSKAIKEEDNLDRFSYVWIAFEALNPYFQEYYNVLEESKCSECGFVREFKGSASLKKFFELEVNNVDLYSKSRRIRNELQHSFKDINTISLKILDLEDELLSSLRQALVFVIDISDEIVNHANYLNAEEIIIMAFVDIRDYFKVEGKDFEPNINIKIEIAEHNSNIVIKPNFECNFLHIGFSSISWDIFGNPGYNITKQQVIITG